MLIFAFLVASFYGVPCDKRCRTIKITPVDKEGSQEEINYSLNMMDERLMMHCECLKLQNAVKHGE